ncbi:MAG: hypothetical protein K2X03_06660 [Bryobacteraceae bacterium]|nr:hypothetical protein [Bryobacteraceae bacterium]
MFENNHQMDSLLPSPQPRVFRLSQSAGPKAQAVLWGSECEAPASLGSCHAGITRALRGDQPIELGWWSETLERHLTQLVDGYMAGCRAAHHWDLPEVVRVHWHAYSIKARLRGARFFPRVWVGASRSLANLQAIHS